MPKGGGNQSRTHPVDRARGQTALVSVTPATPGERCAGPMVVMVETQAPGQSPAIPLQETPSDTPGLDATVILGLGLAACQRGLSVGFTTAAALVHELMEARDERRLLNLQRQLARLQLLIIDELGFVPLSHTGAELLFEVFSQRYERGSILVTTNLPFDEWTEVFGSERLTGALLDRLTHHVHILEMNGESYRLKGSRQSVAAPSSAPDRADAV